MKLRTLFVILVLAIGYNFAVAKINAGAFMNDAAKTIITSKSIEASFKIESNGQTAIIGDIAVKGEKFAITTTANSTIFNGKTQWTISSDDKEISVFEPTADEIAQINPFSIIRSYEKNYNIKLISSDNTAVEIQLIPKKKDTSIKKIVITFGAKTKLPQRMMLTLDDNKVLSIGIFDVRTDADIKSSRFEFIDKNYPGYEIIDLR